MAKLLWKGELTLHRDGYGFVVPENSADPDVFVPARYLGGAWHRDTVVVQVEAPDSRGRREGKVVEVVSHGLTQLVGHVTREDKKWWLVPNDDRIRVRVRISNDPIRKLQENDVVVLRLDSYADKDQEPTGTVIQHLDERGSLATESAIVIAEHQLPQEFAPATVEEAEKLARQSIRVEDGRRDLSAIPLVTIDGETAKDFDDAVAAQIEGNGIRLWIAIADVSHYVRTGSIIDEEAFIRGTSVYFPGFCIPMLPPALSEDVCSLRPNVDRYAMVCEVVLMPNGELKDPQFYRAMIRSHARLTYTQVQEYFDGSSKHLPELPPEVFTSLDLLQKAAKQLRAMRKERGSVDFDLPEPAIELDISTGDVEQIARASRVFAHFLIEELMIMANETVATFLRRSKSACVYRIHDKPNDERVDMILDLLKHLGYNIKIPRPIKPASIGSITRAVHDKPEERFVNHMLLRAMSQAVYDMTNIGHFGLASKSYCHFTSPIRRYPDLMIHRLLGNVIDQQTNKPGKRQKVVTEADSLEGAAQHCSRRERVAMTAEREMVSLYIASFMQQHVGEEFDGIVSHCTKFGFFVELQEYFVEGVVSLEQLTDDRYTFDVNHHMIKGKRSGKTYQIGDKVKVRVKEVDMLKRQTRFELV